jgi:hypothetical protein
MSLRPIRALASVVFVVLAGAVPAAAQAPRTEEQSFAVGAGAFALNDTGHGGNVKAFSMGGYQIFGELVLDSGILFDLRYQNFRLPGAPPTPSFLPTAPRGAPRVDVDAGQVSLGYIFRENWWDAGFVGGVGIYRLSPKAPGIDQVSTDGQETVVGWHGGVLVLFQLAPRLDLRLEATGYLLQSNASHKPIELGGGLAYHF